MERVIEGKAIGLNSKNSLELDDGTNIDINSELEDFVGKRVRVIIEEVNENATK